MKRKATLLILACLVCGCSTPAQRQTREKLAVIIIPVITFRKANVHDVMQFLFEASVAYDSTAEPEKRGVGFVLNLTPTRDEVPIEADPFAEPQPLGSVITFYARYISLLDALDAVSKASGLEYMIDRKGVLQLKAH